MSAPDRVDFVVPEPLHRQVLLIAHVLRVEPADFMLEALRGAVDAALGDRDVRTAVQAIQRLQEREAAPTRAKRGRKATSRDVVTITVGGPVDVVGIAEASVLIERVDTPDEHPPDGSASAPPAAVGSPAADGAGAEPEGDGFPTPTVPEAVGVGESARARLADDVGEADEEALRIQPRSLVRPTRKRLAARPPGPIEPSPPRVLPKGVDGLLLCEPYAARITVETCAMNAHRAKQGEPSRRECRGCVGVVKLAEQRAREQADDAAKVAAS